MATSEASVAAPAAGEHTCCFYDSDDEQRMFLDQFVSAGLASGSRVLCIADGASTRRILAEHTDRPEGRAAVARGQLVVRGSDEAYVAGGFFDPYRMLRSWPQETARALEDGFPELRVTGDVTWYARGLPRVERLLDYERALDDVLAGTPASALCQYDRRRLDDDLLAGARAAHRHAAGGQFPVPPETFRALRAAPGTFQLLGELDASCTGTLSDALGAAVADGAERLTIDLAGLRFMDAAGATALTRPAVEEGITLALLSPQPIVGKVLSILGSDRLPGIRVSNRARQRA